MNTFKHHQVGAFFLFISLFLLNTPARAIVSSEPLKLNPGTSGTIKSLSGYLNFNEGNTDRLVVGTGLSLSKMFPFEDEASRFSEEGVPGIFQKRILLKASYDYGKVSGLKFMKKVFTHARYTHMFNGHLGGVLLAQYESDDFKSLERRVLVGFAIRIEIARSQKFRMWSHPGYFLELEKTSETADNKSVTNHRFAGHLAFAWSFLEGKGLLRSTLFYQPRFDQFSDFRFKEMLDLNFSVSKSLNFGIHFSFDYDNEPTPGITDRDIALKNSVTLEF